MKKILIIKTGNIADEIASLYGDKEDYFIKGTGLPGESFIIINIFKNEDLPDFDTISGIIITGAAAYITEHHEWSEKTARRLPEAVDKNIPLLGVCYGHQLLAYSLGGEVGFNDKGREIGTIPVELTAKAKKDPLFQIFSKRKIYFQASHSQSVIRLPIEAEIIAANNHDPHHAFRISGKNVWGIQFHPEFNAGIIRSIIDDRRERICEEGLNPEELSATCKDFSYGTMLLKRFVEIIMSGNIVK